MLYYVCVPIYYMNYIIISKYKYTEKKRKIQINGKYLNLNNNKLLKIE